MTAHNNKTTTLYLYFLISNYNIVYLTCLDAQKGRVKINKEFVNQ
jgi:hypothetical protein